MSQNGACPACCQRTMRTADKSRLQSVSALTWQTQRQPACPSLMPSKTSLAVEEHFHPMVAYVHTAQVAKHPSLAQCLSQCLRNKHFLSHAWTLTHFVASPGSQLILAAPLLLCLALACAALQCITWISQIPVVATPDTSLRTCEHTRDPQAEHCRDRSSAATHALQLSELLTSGVRSPLMPRLSARMRSTRELNSCGCSRGKPDSSRAVSNNTLARALLLSASLFFSTCQHGISVE